MKRNVTLSVGDGKGNVNKIIDRDVEMVSIEQFSKEIMKIAEDKGWRLESVDFFFTRDRKRGKGKRFTSHDTRFVSVNQW